VSDPDSGAFRGVDAAAVPAVAAFQGADAAFAAGAPFHVSAERSSVFVSLAGFAGSALVWDDDVLDTEVVQVVLDTLLAVATVGGHDARLPLGALDHSFHCRGEPGWVGGVAGLDVVVEDDAVVVVDDLGFVAELDRFAEPSLGDRAGVGVVQADSSSRPVWGGAGQPLTGLPGDPLGRFQQFGKVVDCPRQAATPPASLRIGSAAGLSARRPANWLCGAPVSR
jgi:hypothetical protein